jgi:NTE family protein/lysophospholipid hydrolase
VTTELVLLHPDHEARPIGTSEWLDRRQLHAHHHICIDDQRHYKRLARWLTGQTVGLVLSGGGARGFAHLGAFRALEELGIQIDYVGGTSMGSLLGAGFAMGLDSNEMNKLADAFANPKQLFDYTLPLVSLMASKKVTRLLRRLFGDLYIEDLWLPFFCISSNMTRAEPVVHQSGLLWKSVRASIAIPGIFTPILDEGDLLIDGGPMNNFPVDIMRQYCGGGSVIGVNVSPSEEMKYSYQDGAGISGWQILWSRLNPFVKAIETPSLIANIMRSLEINSVHQIKNKQRLADVLIQPDVGQFGMLDFGSYQLISEAGYLAAREELDRWLEN